MLKLNPNPTFSATVQISVPGSEKTIAVKMVFRHRTMKQITAWFKLQEKRESSEALAELIESWSGIFDDKSNEIEFSRESLTTLLENYQPATNEIIRAYMQELAQSKVKN
ncbi:MAG: phage tail assembly chaperone [Gallionella sp.]|jgi:hypothetical protein